MNEGLTSLDAAALFWWVRNQLYFKQQLWSDERIRIVRYERACNNSEEVAEALADYIEIPLPQHSIATKVRSEPDNGRGMRAISIQTSSGSARKCGTPSRDVRSSEGTV